MRPEKKFEHYCVLLFQKVIRAFPSKLWRRWTAVFLIFGFVSAQSQDFSNLLLRRSLAKNQKSSLLIATSFLSKL
jgi:hypothetical protein